MKKVSYTKSGLLGTNINTGDILEHNLLRVYDNSTNKYHAVENDTIIDYLTKSYGWSVFGDTPGTSQTLLKVFSFESFPESLKFSYLVIEMAEMLTIHPVFHIDWDKVTIKLNTRALNNSISNFDLRSAVLIDQLYYHAGKGDL